ncbi:DUF488 family protein [Nocardia wallacei]|uniref:DUF488 domain-containing protein n=1 Tax=Nocardia wallacei TaxID=480035 RepID=UPI0024559D6A|nr:DUF488 domain-containing protein [Nocardia wallacei]
MRASGAVLTIGHSTHDFQGLVRLLRRHEVTAVADVRSIPASRFAPQFNRDSVQHNFQAAGIKYGFLGKELGVRTDDMTCYVNGRVQYHLLSQKAEFASGITRLVRGARTEKIAIMCAEGEPLDCHRTILIARVLAENGVMVDHIHPDGRLEGHELVMERLMVKFGLAEPDLFRTESERLHEALTRQESRIAYISEDFRAEGAAEI